MPKQGSKGKSSKTARVLNLLTDPGSAAETPEAKTAAAESAAESARLADDRKTQAKIRGALEMELADMPAPAPARPVRPHGPAGILDPKTGFRIVKETGPLPEFEDDGSPVPEPEPKADAKIGRAHV